MDCEAFKDAEDAQETAAAPASVDNAEAVAKPADADASPEPSGGEASDASPAAEADPEAPASVDNADDDSPEARIARASSSDAAADAPQDEDGNVLVIPLGGFYINGIPHTHHFTDADQAAKHVASGAFRYGTAADMKDLAKDRDPDAPQAA